ncbi:MAG: serine/threonine-protein kinase [Thermoleophilaceae bacterium]
MKNDDSLATPQLAGYLAQELIGRGGMGEVYRALDVRLDRPVALKVLAAGVVENERARERLLVESRLAASLDHPNVVPIYEAGEQDGLLFIAMRYVPGRDLRALLRREGALAPERAVAIARQVAGALDAAHRGGLVHRDVKPSNVLLDRQDEGEHCYLADFGLTQSPSERGPTDGQFMGTVAYVSPEQIRGEQVDGRADQYGLACLLFECLTGTVPYGTRSDVAVIFAHLEEPVPPASGRPVELPAALDPVLGRGMAKDPNDRYESCAALVAAVAEALGVGATPRRSRMRRALVLGGAVLALLAAGVAVVLLAGEDRAKAVPPSGALVQVDPRTNEVVGRTGIRGHPGQLAVTPGGLWMADFRGGVLWRYEPAADRLERITSNGEPRDLAAFGDKVYVGADGRFLSGIVSRYDAATGIREDGIDLLACAMASGDGVLWAAGCPFAQRLSTDSGRLRKLVEVFLPYQSPARVENSRVQFREMAIGEGSLWVLGDALDRRLWRLDDRTGRVQATVELDFAPVSVEVAGGLVWITDGVSDRVVPVDPDGERILAPVSVGRGPSGVAAGRGALWVVNTISGTLSRLDPRTRRVVATIDVGGAPRAVAVGAGSVWVTRHAF